MRTYRDRLSAHGFQVNAATDGAAAIAILRSAKPDLVVLELAMPQQSGVEVLKFIRADKRLAGTPVILLTKEYRNDLGRQAISIGIERALLKAQTSPSGLMAAIDEILATHKAASAPEETPLASTMSTSLPQATSAPARARVKVEAPASPPTPAQPSPPVPVTQTEGPPANQPVPVEPPPAAIPFEPVRPAPAVAAAAAKVTAPTEPKRAETAAPLRLVQAEPARAPRSAPVDTQQPRPTGEAAPALGRGTEFVLNAPKIGADLRKIFQSFARAPKTGEERVQYLQDLYRKVHMVATSAGRTQYGRIAQVSSSFGNLLHALLDDPGRLNPAIQHTLASLVDFLELVLQRARETGASPPGTGQVLVVDDDPLSNHLVVSALGEEKLQARSTEDAEAAWKMLQETHFDLFVLDIEMPGLDGFELCKRVRTLPGYKKTPVIFVTVHNDFQNRAKCTLSGGNDLLSKPILPVELTAKVVMFLVKSQLQA